MRDSIHHYLVTLELTLGEYEKHTQYLVAAPDEDKAKTYALALEAHGPARYDTDTCILWDAGEQFAYVASDIDKVKPAHLGVLKQYLHVYTYSKNTVGEMLKDLTS